MDQENDSLQDCVAGVSFRKIYSHWTLLKSKWEGRYQIILSHIKDSPQDAFPKGEEMRSQKGIQGSRGAPPGPGFQDAVSSVERGRQPRGAASGCGGQQGTVLSEQVKHPSPVPSSPVVRSPESRWGQRKEEGKAAACMQSDLSSAGCSWDGLSLREPLPSRLWGNGDQNRLARTHSSWLLKLIGKAETLQGNKATQLPASLLRVRGARIFTVYVCGPVLYRWASLGTSEKLQHRGRVGSREDGHFWTLWTRAYRLVWKEPFSLGQDPTPYSEGMTKINGAGGAPLCRPVQSYSPSSTLELKAHILQDPIIPNCPKCGSTLFFLEKSTLMPSAKTWS